MDQFFNNTSFTKKFILFLIRSKTSLKTCQRYHRNGMKTRSPLEFTFLTATLCYFCIAIQAQPQDVTFKHLLVEHGLPHYNINSVFQDSMGFIWFGSWGSGLIRYDGHDFLEFKHEPGNPNGLKSNSVWVSLQDKEGNIWVMTSDGLYRVDPIRDELLLVDLKGFGRVNCIYVDERNRLWLGGPSGLVIYTHADKSLISILTSEGDATSQLASPIVKIFPAQENEFWLVRERGLQLYNSINDRIIEDYPFEIEPPEKVSRVLMDSNDHIWMGSQNGLFFFDTKESVFSKKYQHEPADPNSLSSSIILSMLEDTKGNLWVGTELGLNLFNQEENNFHRFIQHADDNQTINGNALLDIYEDKIGNVWIGAYGAGVNIISGKSQIRHFTSFQGKGSGLNARFIKSFHENRDGKIWLGADWASGLHLFDPESREFEVYRHEPGNPNSILGNKVWYALEDRNGWVWVACAGKGVSKFKKNTLEFQHYLIDRDFSGNPDIFLQDSKGRIWLKSFTREGSMQYLYDEKADAFFRVKGFCRNLHEDHDQNLLGFTESGIGRINVQTMATEPYLPGVTGIELIVDQNDRVWVAGQLELKCFDLDGNLIAKYGSNEGLPDGGRSGILEDDHGNIWIGTSDGIYLIDSQMRELRLIHKHKLTATNAKGATGKTASGVFYFGTFNGFLTFHPDSIRKDSEVLKVVLTELTLFNQPVSIRGTLGDTLAWPSPLTRSIAYTDELTLNHHQRDFNLKFSALEYLDQDNVRYRYQLENYDTGWKEIGASNRLASYTNLPPGFYNFRVQATLTDHWPEQERRLSIRVLPPWWQTWWAYLTYGLGALGGLFYIRHLELKKQRRKLAVQEEKLAYQKELNAVASKFVPNAFIHSLGRKDIMDVKLGDAVAQDVTVMFSDIRDYASLSETMTPEENFRFVNAFNQRMGPVIQDNQGFVNQYLGDAIMALFKESPTDGLRAAVQMQKTLRLYNEERKEKALPPIRIGIGLHSGPLVMGIIGDDQRMDAATISDTVNTASRIESLTKYFKVNILLSEESLRQIQVEAANHSQLTDSFHFRFLGEVQLKGKQEPTGIYECFDGDQPDIIRKKTESFALFDQAMQMYFSRQFDLSTLAFEKALTIHPEDQTAQHFLEKSRASQVNGVSSEWTGIEVMTFK